jgi:hypothetical protein
MENIGRRGLLGCMAMAGTGIIWTVTGGVPRMLDIASADAASLERLHFVQVSDSHIGFDKDPNHDSTGTFQAAIDKIKAMKNRPAFIMHTGDITHLSKPEEFDTAAQVAGQAGVPVHYVPGEHDWGGDDGALYLERYGKGTKGQGWYAWDEAGVHFVALVNVAGFKAGGFGTLGADQIAWLKDDLADKRASTPIVVMAHMPLWTIDAEWGWKTDDSEQAMALLKRFGSVTVLNGHIHQVIQKVEGHVAFHTAYSTAFPQPAPGTAPSPGPIKTVPADRLRATLGITDLVVKRGQGPLALTNTTLAGV